MRPCIVRGHKATLVRWSFGVSTRCEDGIAMAHAIIEYEDGTLHEAWPHEVKFTDKEAK